MENRYQSNKEDGLQTKPISFWASFALQFVTSKSFCTALRHFRRLSYRKRGVKLGSWRQRFAGDDWDVWYVCWALAGHLFQRLFRQYGRS